MRTRTWVAPWRFPGPRAGAPGACWWCRSGVPTGRGGGTPAVVLILISDPDREKSGIARDLRALYGLTPAEADVAVALAEGKTLDRVAEERGVSRETVRFQLKAIYAKTGTSRQAELARLVLTAPVDFQRGR
ncbi:MAG: helix-turn-helix transcriptional regulator [Alphaproteobacteria bacterium]|nr:helix-turn-helix transcriptional regulator [Alphaproteobacteria bacterium]